MSEKYSVHFECKGCGKLFSVTPRGIQEDFTGYDAVDEALGAWGALMKEDITRGPSTRLWTCPGCRRTYVYQASEAFIQIPPIVDFEISSTITIDKVLDASVAPPQ